MRLIKRYPNRKLYDTENKCYVTLEDLATLICEGHEIQVLDHSTGEDLTAVTLSQIIFEKERKQGGFLPRAVLMGLIKAGGDSLTSRCELAEEEAWRLLKKLLNECDQPWNELRSEDEALQQALLRRGVPTREDLQRLTRQVQTLAQKIDEIV